MVKSSPASVSMESLYELLERLVYKYNGYDSSSIPQEKAQVLLESILYTIDTGLMVMKQTETLSPETVQEETGQVETTPDTDIVEDEAAETLYWQGQEALLKKKDRLEAEWRALRGELSPLRTVYLSGTLHNLDLFFKKYDILFMAHEIPCSIDYWLLLSVPEELKGIHYVEEYMHRLQMENAFLKLFPEEETKQLYVNRFGNWQNMLFDLCEPVLANAVGHALIGESVNDLTVTDGQLRRMERLLAGKENDEIRELFRRTTEALLKELKLKEPEQLAYFGKAAEALAVQAAEAAQHGSLRNVFM